MMEKAHSDNLPLSKQHMNSHEFYDFPSHKCPLSSGIPQPALFESHSERSSYSKFAEIARLIIINPTEKSPSNHHNHH